MAIENQPPIRSMSHPAGENHSKCKSNRVVTAAFGVIFTGLAVAIIVTAVASTLTGSLIAASIVGMLGVDALISAVRNKRSLLSRIGPLP